MNYSGVYPFSQGWASSGTKGRCLRVGEKCDLRALSAPIDVMGLAANGPPQAFGPADKLTSAVLPGFQHDVSHVFERPW